MEKKLLLVYNPISGKGHIKSHISDIIDIYSAKDFSITVHPTKCANDGYEYIKEHATEYDVISVCGGDGMLNETVNALMNVPAEQRPTIAYLPSGSTNDFAGTVGLPSDVKLAAQMVMEGSPFFCDTGLMNDKYFAYVAAFGLFTSVSYDTSQDYKNLFGRLAYILGGIRQLASIKEYHMKISFDDIVIEDDFIFGMVTNSLQVGGIKNNIFSTAVSLNDGLFEVLLVKKPKNASGYQGIVSAFLTQNIEKSEDIISFKVSSIKFETDAEIPWTVDGEFGGNTACADIKLLPKGFSVLV